MYLCLSSKMMAERVLAKKVLKLVHKSYKAELVNTTWFLTSPSICSSGLLVRRREGKKELPVKQGSLPLIMII